MIRRDDANATFIESFENSTSPDPSFTKNVLSFVARLSREMIAAIFVGDRSLRHRSIHFSIHVYGYGGRNDAG
jgi:hypothetical protein